MKANNKNYFAERNVKSAFTLIELLLYLGLMVIIILASANFLSIILTDQVKNQTIATVEEQGMEAMQIINQAIRNAVKINSPATGTNSPTLSINTVDSGKNPTVFDLNSGTIRIKEGAGTTIPLTASSFVTVSNLSFQNLTKGSSPGIIRTTFTLNYLNASGNNLYNFSKTFSSSAALRNK